MRPCAYVKYKETHYKPCQKAAVAGAAFCLEHLKLQQEKAGARPARDKARWDRLYGPSEGETLARNPRNPPISSWDSVCRVLRQKFDYYNRRVFDLGINHPVKLACKMLKRESGKTTAKLQGTGKRQMSPDGRSLVPVYELSTPITITLSTKNFYEEADVDKILLHEMIHAQLYVLGDFFDNHGPSFKTLAGMVERKTGLAIPITHDTSGAALAVKGKKMGVLVMTFTANGDAAFWLFNVKNTMDWVGFAERVSKHAGYKVVVHHVNTQAWARYKVSNKPPSPSRNTKTYTLTDQDKKNLNLSEATGVAAFHPKPK